MGYPMTYWRVLTRNHLLGDYGVPPEPGSGSLGLIRGDLRRLEMDQRDRWHLEKYAKKADVTVQQAKAILDLFFDGEDWDMAQRRLREQEPRFQRKPKCRCEPSCQCESA